MIGRGPLGLGFCPLFPIETNLRARTMEDDIPRHPKSVLLCFQLWFLAGVPDALVIIIR